jgi:hypothetical protein
LLAPRHRLGPPTCWSGLWKCPVAALHHLAGGSGGNPGGISSSNDDLPHVQQTGAWQVAAWRCAECVVFLLSAACSVFLCCIFSWTVAPVASLAYQQLSLLLAKFPNRYPLPVHTGIILGVTFREFGQQTIAIGHQLLEAAFVYMVAMSNSGGKAKARVQSSIGLHSFSAERV